MAKIYAISDIHGHNNEFIKSLNKIDLSDKQSKLILLGDYIDYGSQSFQVISKIIELEKIYPKQIITLFGNHEEWFYDWLILDNPTASAFPETIKSFFSTEELNYILKTNPNNFETGVRNEIKNNIKFIPFINWLKNDIEINAIIMKLIVKSLFMQALMKRMAKNSITGENEVNLLTIKRIISGCSILDTMRFSDFKHFIPKSL
ncbi:serine/threonine protein phosphatase 1 [Streptococcus pneumoniae]|nr:serine/threonine protein phosphatase [Streptococcus pneumoniae]CJH36241.1 serine/threonine protein phosphatase [Streptococcus pneumoniae]CJR36627.1 serine/threonine protein phosphatase [Streptococcus pneumoniae]CKB00804.1 serine/threonine protein phosphatase [Streptococcus pneumoniae]CKG83595.1 serine/threonine protein phosphatase [Streptococcus pneumoniae]